MQNAVIFLVEDDEICRKFARRELEAAGHKVALEATNLEEALKAVNGGQLQEMGINVAVVDGYLPEADGGGIKFVGPEISGTIRDMAPLIKIVSHSSLSSDMVNYGDVHACKRDQRPLETAIASL